MYKYYFSCNQYNNYIILYFTGGDGTYHLKVLVPGVAAGAIIGKGGDTIAQLQKDTGARVKMSKSHDFYPGILKIFISVISLLKDNIIYLYIIILYDL